MTGEPADSACTPAHSTRFAERGLPASARASARACARARARSTAPRMTAIRGSVTDGLIAPSTLGTPWISAPAGPAFDPEPPGAASTRAPGPSNRPGTAFPSPSRSARARSRRLASSATSTPQTTPAGAASNTMQSTGHGGAHNSQPVHHWVTTACMCLADPTMASTGQARMHKVQPMQSASMMRASRRGLPRARTSAGSPGGGINRGEDTGVQPPS